MSRPTAVTAIATSPTCQMMRGGREEENPAASTRCCGARRRRPFGKDRAVEKLVQEVELQGISDRADLLPLLPTDHDRKQLESTFEKFDKDGSGEIDIRELGTLLEEAAGHPLSDDEVGMIMLEVDADGSGTIDFEEFASVYVRISRGDLVPKALKHTHQQFELLFDKMVEDDDDNEDN